MTNEQMRQRIAELEEGLREAMLSFGEIGAYWNGSRTDGAMHDALDTIAGLAADAQSRAASLLSAPPPASDPGADVVERVAKFSQIADAMRVEATRYDHRPGNKAFNDDHVSAAQNLRGYASQIDAALTAMPPAIDREKVAEIRFAIDAAISWLSGWASAEQELAQLKIGSRRAAQNDRRAER